MSAENKESISPQVQKSKRIASIDWMRGLVMVLMVIDHASMAFDGFHVAKDSALYPDAATMYLPAAEFITRWITHLCAPSFVFLAGTALALSVERRVAKGLKGWAIDRGIVIRGALIALLDLTIISIGSGRWTLQVLLAIGVSMMLMAPLRRLPTWALLTIGIGWMFFGEFPTDWVWDPPGSASVLASLTMATYGSETMIIKYPILPWLAFMIVGWVFGRYIVEFNAGKRKLSPKMIMLISGVICIVVFFVFRYLQGYGNMFLNRSDGSWQQWLHVSKYPPSLTYYGLEMGLLCLILALLIHVEPIIKVRQNGFFLVLGQAAMFFYLVHRLAYEIPATYFGLRGAGNISTTYIVTALSLIPLYYGCRWYRDVKQSHPESVLKYF